MTYKNCQFFFILCLTLLFNGSCDHREKRSSTLFKKIPAAHTNIHFANTLQEDEDFNIIEYLYFYNGGGVAVGDINNDSLPDIYFSSNQGSNKLYLNQGDFVFKDITANAGVEGAGNWKTGVTMADVNGDGLLDIYSCGVGNYKKFRGKNQLFINNGDLTFTDATVQSGLSFQGFSTHSAFFDYDNDGDLDMYLLNHSIHSIGKYDQASVRFEVHPLAGDKLFRNELVPTGRMYFSDVTAEAGILSSQIGYGLGIGISDLDLDGYADIYVSNDFRENDYLYINQRDGTFKQVLENSIPHTSRFSMGNDIGDINNDGWKDIVTLDMLPKDEGIIKTTAGDDPYDIFHFKIRFGYHPQLARNNLQMNRGITPSGELAFSDIAPFAGIEATDWSWSALLADFDNDGLKDLFITNGIVRRPNDLDYINFISDNSKKKSFDNQYIEKMPSGEVPNVVFRNEGRLRYKDMSKEWLGLEPSASTGAAYADFDNDGDLDIVTNNVNEQAFVYRNDLPLESSRYLKFRLHGASANRFGIGVKIAVHCGDETMHLEQMPSRGWQSSVEPVLHVGLGKRQVDSITVTWPHGNKAQVLREIDDRQCIDLFEQNAVTSEISRPSSKASWALQLVYDSLYRHFENDFVSFNFERLIPHTAATEGPKISRGDVNGDGIDDLFIGGAAGQPGALFIQRPSGGFIKSDQSFVISDALREDTDAAFFDADGNGTLDLIVVGGGQQFHGRDERLLPALYLNDGRGNLVRSRASLPEIFVDASCVTTADVDGDGDYDVFIGGRVVAGHYGVKPRSHMLINNGKGIFADESGKWFHGVTELGMVTDAQWVDINQDERMDLVVVGEWMPITIFIQNGAGEFVDRTVEYGLATSNGWWNTVVNCDVDGDGDADLLAGNAGLNSRLRASPEEPVNLFVVDIDRNEALDHILTYYNGGSEHPFISRDQLVKQVPSLKRKFLKYEAFRNVRLQDILPVGSTPGNKVTNFASVYLENTGDSKFVIHALPDEAQLFPVYAINVDDVNGDGHFDVLLAGNLYGVQPDIGRSDAGYGLILLGDGQGHFTAVEQAESGFFVPGESRDIETLVNARGVKFYVVSRNNDQLLIFR